MDKISDKDKAIIDVASLEKKIAELNLENASLRLRIKVLELYLNYGLTKEHVIDNEGNIKLNEPKQEK